MGDTKAARDSRRRRIARRSAFIATAITGLSRANKQQTTNRPIPRRQNGAIMRHLAPPNKYMPCKNRQR